jgi:Domain of unknown function (DUF4389)
MNDQPPETVSRGQIFIRLLFTLLFLPIYGICNALIVLTTVFQFALLFITLKHSEPVRAFANRVISYAYRVWRYVSLNSSPRPFPFAEFPADLEPPEAEVRFD